MHLGRASIGSCDGIGLTCKGRLSLTGARISGDLDLTGAALETADGRPALLGQRAWIDGKLVLSGIKAHGEVDLRTVKVGASLLLNGARRPIFHLYGPPAIAGEITPRPLVSPSGVVEFPYRGCRPDM